MLSLIIVFFTILICSQGNLMYENLTGVSLMEGMHIWVILFTFLSSIFYAYKTHWLYKQLHYKRNYINPLIFITMICMCLGSLFPYTLNSQDILSSLHVYFSMFPCLSFLILLFIYNRFLSYENYELYSRVHWFFDLGIQFLGIFFIVFTRVNGYLEILFSILVSGYLFILEKNIKKVNILSNNKE